MNNLSNEVIHEKQNYGKNMAVLKAKKHLMSILVDKIVEYLRTADSDLSGDIINEIAKQYDALID